MSLMRGRRATISVTRFAGDDNGGGDEWSWRERERERERGRERERERERERSKSGSKKMTEVRDKTRRNWSGVLYTIK